MTRKTPNRLFPLSLPLLLLSLHLIPATLQAQTITLEPDPTIAPAIVSQPAQTPQLLLRPGYMISGRSAKLIRHPQDTRWFLVFDYDHLLESSDPFARPMQVLPGKWLTAMTQVVGSRTDLSVTFRIWGEVTVYKQTNYVLPNFVATLSMFGSAPAPAPADQSITPTAQHDDNSLIPEKLRQSLLAIPRTQPLEIPEELDDKTTTPSPPTEPATRPPDASNSLNDSTLPQTDPGSPPKTPATSWTEGQLITDRVGRVLYDSDQKSWMLLFEADSTTLAEPPVNLHPCGLLEEMERQMLHATRSITFRVSGRITKYQGQCYMFLTKALQVRPLGNLGK